jgi:hypothetical protein
MFTCTIKKDGKALTDSKKEDLAVWCLFVCLFVSFRFIILANLLGFH